MEAEGTRFPPPPLPPSPGSASGWPVAPRRPAVHRMHGVSRPDDYAWLSDPQDPQALAYLRAEQDWYTERTGHLRPLRARLEAEMAGRTPTVDTSVAWRRAGIVYFTRSQPGADHDLLLRFDPAPGPAGRPGRRPGQARTGQARTGQARTGQARTGQARIDPAEAEQDQAEQNQAEQNQGGQVRLVLDPNTVAPGVDHLEVGLVEPSPDGALVAYTVDLAGTGAFELRFRDVARQIDLPDLIHGVSGSGAWSADGGSFLYTVPDPTHRPHQVRRHVLGSQPVDDPVLVTETDPRFALDVRASRDGRWLLLSAAARASSEVSLLSAADPGEPPRMVARRRPGIAYSVEPLPGGWDGTGTDLLLIVTDDGAPEFRLMQAPVPPPGGRGEPGGWQPVVGLPGASHERLESVAVLARHVLLMLRRDCEPFLRVIDRPVPGAAPPVRPVTREVHPGVPYGHLRLWHLEDPQTSHAVIVEENLVTAPAWVEVDLDTGARTVLKRTQVPGTDPTRYVTDRLYATAPDGVRVPVTVAHRRDARRGRTAGCLLTGYGAYESCRWPRFELGTLSLIDRGLVYAVAHVRGGGELGRSWWLSGRGRGKPRTFVDYVAARDALVAAGWAGEVRGGARVVTRGGWAGGLLQGAVYSRAPRMWRAVIAEVPFVDVVTTMSDPTAPMAAEEREEWGDPALDRDDFTAMLSWSPYDNPPPPGRPPLLVTGTWTDRRVRVHEPAKWVARLRATDSAAPASTVLLRVELAEAAEDAAGRHGRLRYEAEILAWALDNLGLD